MPRLGPTPSQTAGPYFSMRLGAEGENILISQDVPGERVRIEGRVLDAFLNNVTVVMGDQANAGLPPNCCDAILLRLVYHHFVVPEEMRGSLRQALKPGGLLAIVDISPQSSWRDLPGVPDRGGHGIPIADLIHEMTTDGFEVVSRQDEWNGDQDRYCVVFRR